VCSLTWWDWIKAAIQQLSFNYAAMRRDQSDLVLDEQMPGLPKHPQASLFLSEVTTISSLHATIRSR
jgi:hypothetical protein